MNMRINLTVGCLCVGTAAVASLGQAIMTQRASTLIYNYVYGAGADTNVGGDTILDPILLQTDAEHAQFGGQTSGFLPGMQPYAASVQCTLDHQYEIFGPFAGFQGVTAGASTFVTAAASGLGSALMNSNNPGNELFLYFTLGATVPYRLFGFVSTPAPSAFTFVALQQFDGLVWQYVFYSAFLPGQQGNFDVAGALTPGSYRLWSAIALNAGANQGLSATYHYEFGIPSPAGAGLLGLAAVAGLRRRRV